MQLIGVGADANALHGDYRRIRQPRAPIVRVSLGRAGIGRHRRVRRVGKPAKPAEARLTGDVGISDALGVGRLVDLASVGDVGGASVAPSNVSLVLTRGGGGRANPSIAVGERERKVASWYSSSSSSSMDPGSMLLDLLSSCRPTPPGAEFAERSSTSASIFAHVSSTTRVSPRTSIANFWVRLLLLTLIRTIAPVSSMIFRRNSPLSVAMKLALV